IWGALLGSVATIVAVVIANRHHISVQRAQLDHESRERDKQRKFDSRATVYLAAAAEMVKAQEVLGKLSVIDFSQQNPGELLSSFASSANQAILIASDDTAEAINEFLSAFFAAFFGLLPRVSPIQVARTDRDIHDTAYQAYQSEVKRILATMTYINETKRYGEADWDTLNRNWEFNQARSQEAAELRDRAWNEINRLSLEFLDEVMNQSKVIARAALPAMVGIRADLEISTDAAAFRGQLERRLALMDGLMGELKSFLRQAAT
ncbi:MAG: hypothetical protein ACREQ3_19355, partial [Candidatus Binatia bacterium]